MTNNKPILYNVDLSPPVRYVKIVAKLIGVELDIRDVDLFNGENKQEWFLKLNPEHSVPTLVDSDGFVIWESHAIAMYLIEKYAQDDQLYPKDVQKRARCNQRLFFQSGLFSCVRDNCSYHIIFRGNVDIPQANIDLVYGKFDTLETFLANDPYLVDDCLTIADISVACIVSSAEAAYAPLYPERYPKVLAWLKRIKDKYPIFDEMNTKYVEQHHVGYLGTTQFNSRLELSCGELS